MAQGMRLTTGVAALWLLLAGPAFFLRGVLGLEGLSYAALIGLGPGWLVLFLASKFSSAENAAAPVLLGMFLRMVFVLFGVALVRNLRPMLGIWEFIIWVLVFYLAALAMETSLVLRRKSA